MPAPSPTHPSPRSAAPMLVMVSVARSCKNRTSHGGGEDITSWMWQSAGRIRPPHHLTNGINGRELNHHDNLGYSPFLEVSHSGDAASGVIKDSKNNVGITMAYLGSLDNVVCHPPRGALGTLLKHVNLYQGTLQHVNTLLVGPCTGTRVTHGYAEM